MRPASAHEVLCLCVQERTGSSLPAIGKYLEGKHPGLPGPWKKTLSYQIRSLAEKGKLVKVGPAVKAPFGGAKPVVVRPAAGRPGRSTVCKTLLWTPKDA